MARASNPTPDCHFLLKAAVRVERAAPSRGFTTAAGAPGANADCRFPGEGGVREPLPATSAADPDTLQKHTFGCASGDTGSGPAAPSHTTVAGSPSSGGGADTDGAHSEATARARALDDAGAGAARPAGTTRHRRTRRHRGPAPRGSPAPPNPRPRFPRFRPSCRACPLPSRTGERIQLWIAPQVPRMPMPEIWNPGAGEVDSARRQRTRRTQQGRSRTSRATSSSLSSA